MPLSAASILHAFLLTILLGTTASIPHGDGDVNPSTMFTNGTGTSSPNADDTETYICYLCTGRNPLLIRYCPIYWDKCHLVCYDEYDASSAATAAIPAAPAPAPTASLGSSAASGVYNDECYVMKLYRNGSYTIVTRLGCAGIARCLLSCGGGDMADSDRKAPGTATTAVPAPTTAALQGSLTPRPADFQRCDTQVTAPPSLRGAAVVRDGGARRRR